MPPVNPVKQIHVTFPGGKRVDAHLANGLTVHTDQSLEHGGEESAPEPFDLFFVSLATCVGIYALEFCAARNLDTNGLAVQLEAERDPDRRLFTPIRIALTLPSGFPDRYRPAILRAVDLCTVKKHILNPPDFEITTLDLPPAP